MLNNILIERKEREKKSKIRENKVSFTPSSALTANTAYTKAKNAAGSATATNYKWSFTTAPAAIIISFATQGLRKELSKRQLVIGLPFLAINRVNPI